MAVFGGAGDNGVGSGATRAILGVQTGDGGLGGGSCRGAKEVARPRMGAGEDACEGGALATAGTAIVGATVGKHAGCSLSKRSGGLSGSTVGGNGESRDIGGEVGIEDTASNGEEGDGASGARRGSWLGRLGAIGAA